MELANKTALVTGGAKGIGKAIAQRFKTEGANVIVFDLEKPDYETTYYHVDIKDEKQIQQAISEIKKLDVLVNNAGVYTQAPVEHTTKEELDHLTDTNFKGTFLMCKHALPLIKKNKGNIINITSGLAIAPEPESAAYCATKAAINMLTKCLAQEHAKNGIRINAILPGPIDTPLLRKALNTPEERNTYAQQNPMRRLGTPQEVANIAAFLASEEASYVTGASYSVDGGESSSSLYTK